MIDQNARQPTRTTYPDTYPGNIAGLLQDILHELRLLNETFKCKRFLAIPDVLVAIKDNTRKVSGAKRNVKSVA